MGHGTETPCSLSGVFGEDLLTEVLRGKLRELAQTVLEAEIDDALAAARHERAEQRAGFRHGTKSRTLHTSFGSTELAVPRARLMRADGTSQEFQSRLLPRYERRTRSLDETVVSLYLSGTNTRRVERAMRPMLSNAPLSRSVVSRLVAQLGEHQKEWKARKLGLVTYVYLYLDAKMFAVRVGHKVRQIPVLVALGVRLDGQKELLGFESFAKESEPAWTEFLEGLVKRGLNRPKLGIIDGHAGLHKAVEITWPKLPIQRCTVHKLRNLEQKCPADLYPEMKEDYHAIVDATSLDTAREAWKRFVAQWQKSVPSVVASLEEAGDELLTFFRFPKEQWKCLRTTNPIERLNCEFERRVKTQCSLPNEDAAMLLLFGLIASGQIRFRKIDGWEKIVEVVHNESLTKVAS